MAKHTKEPKTFTVARGDGWHITYTLGADFGAFVGDNCLGYFQDQHIAQAWIDEYQYQQAVQAGRQVAA